MTTPGETKLYLQIICAPYLAREILKWMKDHQCPIVLASEIPLTKQQVILVDVQSYVQAKRNEFYAFLIKEISLNHAKAAAVAMEKMVEEESSSDAFHCYMVHVPMESSLDADKVREVLELVDKAGLVTRYDPIERFTFLFEHKRYRIREFEEDGDVSIIHIETNKVLKWRFKVMDGIFGTTNSRRYLNMNAIVDDLWKQIRQQLPADYKIGQIVFSRNYW